MLVKSRGVSIASVLVLGVLASIAAFTLAAVTTSHLNYAQKYANGLDALNLAEAAIAEALSQIHQKGAPPGTDIRVLPDASEPDREGFITFKGDPDDPTLPVSVNNLDGHLPGPVPPGMARLTARGRSRGTTRHLEVLVAAPDFPYVVAVAGNLVAHSSLIVQDATVPQDSSHPQTQGVHASVGANGSVTVDGTCEIDGDLVAGGTVSVPNDAVIGGRVRTGQVDLPDGVNIDAFDPSGNPNAKLLDGSGGGAPRPPGMITPPVSFGGAAIGMSTTLTDNGGLTGLNYTDGDLTLTNGLTLSGALLFVKGNLTVQGGVRGQGAIFVKGTASIEGSDSVAADDLVALMSNGDITLTGTSADTRYFQGMIFTRGNFTASGITIAGSFAIADPLGVGSQPGNMTLNGIRMVRVPDAVNFKLTIVQASSTTPGIPTGSQPFHITLAGPTVYTYASGVTSTNPNLKGQGPVVSQDSTGALAVDGTSDGSAIAGAAVATSVYNGTSNASTKPVDLTVNRFVSNPQPLRVVSWKEP